MLRCFRLSTVRCSESTLLTAARRLFRSSTVLRQSSRASPAASSSRARVVDAKTRGSPARVAGRSSSASSSSGGTAGGSVQQFFDGFYRWKDDVTEKVVGGGAGATGSKKRKIMGWIIDNFGGILAYQLLIETMLTGLLAAYLAKGTLTKENVTSFLTDDVQYPFVSWIDFDGAVYTEDPVVFGHVVMYARTATILHTAHNISYALMPLQITFMLATYPFLLLAWPRISGPLMKIPLAKYAFSPVKTPAEVAHWANRRFGSNLGAADAGKSSQAQQQTSVGRGRR